MAEASPVLTPNPKCATAVSGVMIVGLVVASWEWAKDTMQERQGIPASALATHSAPMAANRHR